jgi:hypothetical protein
MSRGWVADTHVHLYPEYDLGLLFHAALRHLRTLAARADDRPVLFLAERADCHAFAALRSGSASLPPGLVLRGADEPDRLWIDEREGGSMLLIAGRQVRTRERLEVLCLGADADLADGLALEAAVEGVRAAGGLPVLPWSPGKWSGRRGRDVRALLQRSGPGDLWVGDISMRPHGWPLPRAFRIARARGIGILAGTDPLPAAGEEGVVGRYGIRVEGESPTDALRANPAAVSVIGSRDGAVTAARRWIASSRRSRNR